jgi:hypothetical protein
MYTRFCYRYSPVLGSISANRGALFWIKLSPTTGKKTAIGAGSDMHIKWARISLVLNDAGSANCSYSATSRERGKSSFRKSPYREW